MKVLLIIFLLLPVFLFAGEFNESASMPLIFDQGAPQNTLTPYAGISQGGAFALNFFLGFGIGSFFQRDAWGGAIGLTGDLVGIGMTTVGLLGMIGTGFQNLFSLFGRDSEREENPVYNALCVAGVFIWLGSRVFQMIRPWFYKYPEDFKVTASLNEDGRVAVSALWCLKY